MSVPVGIALDQARAILALKAEVARLRKESSLLRCPGCLLPLTCPVCPGQETGGA